MLNRTKSKNDDYEPYGKAWEKEMMKMTKKELIAFIRRIKTKTGA